MSISGGTLLLTGSPIINSSRAFSLGGTANFNAQSGFSPAIAGVISGTGPLTTTGTGTLILSGLNSYTAGTLINSGTLSVSGSITGDVTIAGGATFDVANSFTIGNLIGSAANSFVTIESGKVLTFGTATGLTFPGQISGLGGLIKQGTGTEIFSGTNSYTGGTTINAGTLSITGSITGDVTVGAGATFGVATNVTIGNLIGSAANGFATIASGDTLTLGTGANASFAGQISGLGGLIKQGIGTQTLSGTNSYAAGTTISAGILSVSGSITGDVSVAGGATFDVANSFTIGNLIGSAANSRVTLESGATLTFGAATSATFPGQISGLGGLIKQGMGTQIFLGQIAIQGGRQSMPAL